MSLSIGKRIRLIRKKRGMTQKALGLALGFSDKQADVRMNQYESGSRTPNHALLEKMAATLDVSPKALNVPDFKSDLDLLFLLFSLEDEFGFRISRSGSYTYLMLDEAGSRDPALQNLFSTWSSYAEMLKSGQISREEYDRWRYTLGLPKSKKRTQAPSG